jgi:hypothetical protein
MEQIIVEKTITLDSDHNMFFEPELSGVKRIKPSCYSPSGNYMACFEKGQVSEHRHV